MIAVRTYIKTEEQYGEQGDHITPAPHNECAIQLSLQNTSEHGQHPEELLGGLTSIASASSVTATYTAVFVRFRFVSTIAKNASGAFGLSKWPVYAWKVRIKSTIQC